jgi:hypothetical protein
MTLLKIPNGTVYDPANGEVIQEGQRGADFDSADLSRP